MRVAVVYHFFAHYRRAVVESLARDDTHEWHFIGVVRDFVSDIKPAELSARVRFHRCSTTLIEKRSYGETMQAMHRRERSCTMTSHRALHHTTSTPQRIRQSMRVYICQHTYTMRTRV